jgi:DNA polymerase elongation subunit (family B)
MGTVKMLFLDAETFAHRGLFWGLFNQTLSIDKIEEPGRTLCAAWKWSAEKKVEFAAEWHPVKEREGWFCYKEFLKRLHEVLDEADVVVTYNGKRFDIPTLYKEFVLHGLPPPSPFHHIDLYQTVRRQFRFASNKLDYVCQQLGLGAKTQHKGMQLWKDVDKGCHKAQAVMERYNKQDVKLLEKLYNHIKPWIKNHPNIALLEEKQGVVCPTCGSDDVNFEGYRYTKTRRYRRFQCKKCHSWGSVTTSDKEVVGETTSV